MEEVTSGIREYDTEYDAEDVAGENSELIFPSLWLRGKFWDKQEEISEMTKSLSVTSGNTELNFWTRKVKRPILIKFLRNVLQSDLKKLLLYCTSSTVK